MRVPYLAPFVLLAACGFTNMTTATGDETGSGTGTGTGTGTSAGTEDPTGGGPASDVTIYDLQQMKVEPNTRVRVVDVVVVSPTSFSGSGAGTVFIQDPMGGEYSGIQLYIYADTAMELMAQGKVPKMGDKITVSGDYVEFKAMGSMSDETYSEINVGAAADLTISGSATAPTPPVVDPADISTTGAKRENWEGVPVTVQDVQVTNPDLGFGEFEVTGGLRIDDLFFLPKGGPKPLMGDVISATGPLVYSFDNFKLAPRNCDDYVGVDCTADPTTTTTGPMGDVTIFDIQQGMVPEMSVVTVENVIVTTPLTFKKDGFFVQDPMGGEYSGIYVYVGMNPDMIAPKPGDVVTINGLYTEYFGMSQLAASQTGDVTVTGTDLVPAPAVVPAADVATAGTKMENWEGVLIRVENVTVMTEADMFGEWIVDDMLHVDDLFFAAADWPKPMAGATFTSITGPLFYSFDNSKIVPRAADDLVQ